MVLEEAGGCLSFLMDLIPETLFGWIGRKALFLLTFGIKRDGLGTSFRDSMFGALVIFVVSLAVIWFVA